MTIELRYKYNNNIMINANQKIKILKLNNKI